MRLQPSLCSELAYEKNLCIILHQAQSKPCYLKVQTRILPGESEICDLGRFGKPKPRACTRGITGQRRAWAVGKKPDSLEVDDPLLPRLKQGTYFILAKSPASSVF